MLLSGEGGGGGSETDIEDVHIMGVAEFWDRHSKC